MRIVENNCFDGPPWYLRYGQNSPKRPLPLTGTVQDWVFFNGEDDEKVTGRVVAVESVHTLAYFTVRPSSSPLPTL